MLRLFIIEPLESFDDPASKVIWTPRILRARAFGVKRNIFGAPRRPASGRAPRVVAWQSEPAPSTGCTVETSRNSSGSCTSRGRSPVPADGGDRAQSLDRRRALGGARRVGPRRGARARPDEPRGTPVARGRAASRRDRHRGEPRGRRGHDRGGGPRRHHRRAGAPRDGPPRDAGRDGRARRGASWIDGGPTRCAARARRRRRARRARPGAGVRRARAPGPAPRVGGCPAPRARRGGHRAAGLRRQRREPRRGRRAPLRRRTRRRRHGLPQRRRERHRRRPHRARVARRRIRRLRRRVRAEPAGHRGRRATGGPRAACSRTR